MRMVDIIQKKRDGKSLTAEEIKFFVDGYTKDEIPDYQASALAMAIYFQGMNDIECAELTLNLAKSGEFIDLSKIDGIKVDKHSTGGVGDTTTLVLAPLVAAVGVPVAKMSGRGLGHTGGTLDKLDAITNLTTELSTEKFIELVNRDKIAILSQTQNITPGDKKLYALRDVTGTVESMPLIASSVMSKKIASGADAIVLDVKVGDGAFMKTLPEAEKLAKTMVDIGNQLNRKTMAIISDMSQPLGRAIGNALEVEEAINMLKGDAPEDLYEITMVLGSQMVYLAKKANSLDDARKMLENAIKNGTALQKLKDFIKNQGGDPSVVDDPKKLPQAKYKIELPAKQDGFVSQLIANKIGEAAMKLGAGRATKDDKIDLAVGIVLNKKVGDPIKKGESLLTIYSNRENIDEVKNILYENIKIADSAKAPTLIQSIILE